MVLLSELSELRPGAKRERQLVWTSFSLKLSHALGNSCWPQQVRIWQTFNLNRLKFELTRSLGELNCHQVSVTLALVWLGPYKLRYRANQQLIPDKTLPILQLDHQWPTFILYSHINPDWNPHWSLLWRTYQRPSETFSGLCCSWRSNGNLPFLFLEI